MLVETWYYCAYCGRRVDTVVDPYTSPRAHYVEDCQVCCRPNRLSVERDPVSGAITIWAAAESDIA